MTTNNVSQQHNDLKSIGLILKKKREELSYTLEHVSEITRITLTCLRNIEEGNMAALPGLVFVRGFIRNYAKLLGLESDWMIDGLNQTYNAAGDHTESSTSEGNSRDRKKGEKREKSNTLIYSIGIATACVLLVAVYILYQKPSDKLTLMNESIETVQAIENSEVQTEVAPSETLIDREAPAEPTAQAKAEEPIPTTIISPLTLTLVANSNDWIRLAIDGHDAFELKLKKGEKYDWPAEEGYALVMTTGATASIHLNGEEIVDREAFLEQLYEAKLNKFTLKQINNR